MSKFKHSHSPAAVEEPPSKRRNNHLFWANAEETTKQTDNIYTSKQPQVFQAGSYWDGRSSQSENIFSNGDSYNVLAEHHLGDCSSIEGCSSSVTDSWGNNIIPHNLVNVEPQLFDESMSDAIWASPIEKQSSSLSNPIASRAAILSLRELRSDIIYPVIGNGIAYDIDTLSLQTTSGYLQSDMPETGVPANSMSEANSKSPVIGDSGVWWQESSCDDPLVEVPLNLARDGSSNFHSQSINPTTSKNEGRNVDKADQIEKLCRNRDGIRKAIHNISKLENRLQGWNKHQMDAVQEIPNVQHDVRLGDIVVSSRDGDQGGFFQYDFGKTIQDQNFHYTQHLNQPSPLLLAAVSGLEAMFEVDGHQLEAQMTQILEKKPRLRKKYSRPPAMSDKLYRSHIVHLDPHITRSSSFLHQPATPNIGRCVDGLDLPRSYLPAVATAVIMPTPTAGPPPYSEHLSIEQQSPHASIVASPQGPLSITARVRNASKLAIDLRYSVVKAKCPTKVIMDWTPKQKFSTMSLAAFEKDVPHQLSADSKGWLFTLTGPSIKYETSVLKNHEDMHRSRMDAMEHILRRSIFKNKSLGQLCYSIQVEAMIEDEQHELDAAIYEGELDF